MTDFLWSVKNGELKEVKEHVEKQGKNVNEKIEGRYPLHYAADYGQTDVIDYLIGKGADVNAEDKHGISPVLAAIWEGHTASVKLLLAKGASSKGKSPEGKSYFECAEKDDIRKLLE